MILTEKSDSDEEIWKAERDFETLKDAQEIMNDESRQKRVKEFALKQSKALKEVTDGDYFKSIGLR